MGKGKESITLLYAFAFRPTRLRLKMVWFKNPEYYFKFNLR